MQILIGSQVFVKPRRFNQRADPASACVVDRFPEQFNLTAVPEYHTEDHFHGSRFACTVFSDKAVNIALADIHAYLVRHGFLTVNYVPTVNSFVVNPDGTETKITDYYYNAYADAGQTIHIDCEILGAEIIVDEAEGTQESGIDPETAEGPTVYIGAVTAHAGQKNVPVNVYVRGCDPFVSGTLRFGYDSALKSLLYDCYAEYDSDVTEDSRLGISVDGTLLENVMTLRSSSIHGNTIMVSFNNYRAFGYDSKGIPTVFRNGETQADAAITEDGVLFTMYFDMPEECGQYRIFASEGTLGGGAQDEPGCLPNQTVQNFIPCDITVIP